MARRLGFALAGVVMLSGLHACDSGSSPRVEWASDAATPVMPARAERPASRDRVISTLADLPLPWQRLAMCESSGHVDSSGGDHGQYQGLFQIEFPRTWHAHGGVTEPTTAASVAEQYRVALHIYADRGYRPWPHCGKYLLEAYGR